MATKKSPLDSVPDERTEIVPGLVREWFMDRHILAFTLRNLSQTCMRTWEQEVYIAFATFPSGQPIYYMHDTSWLGMAQFTPRVQEIVSGTIHKVAHLPGRTAAVIAHPLVAEVLNTFLRAQPQGKRERRVFPSRERALMWLREAVMLDSLASARR